MKYGIEPLIILTIMLTIDSSISIEIKSKELFLNFKPKPIKRLQKGGVPAAPSGTATLLRLSPSY